MTQNKNVNIRVSMSTKSARKNGGFARLLIGRRRKGLRNLNRICYPF